MSKLDNNVINNIKMLSLDMIKEARVGDSNLAINASSIFYALFMKHLKFNINNPNWINRDRVIVSNRFLPIMYSTLHLFGFDISLENLKDYRKFNSNINSFGNINTPGIEVSSNNIGDVISSSVGIALGERYIESLIKIENPKCNLINFNTYCICTYEDIMSGLAYESLSYASKENLNKLIFIVVKDRFTKDGVTKEEYNEDSHKFFDSLNYNFVELKGTNFSDIDAEIDLAKDNKNPSIILINPKISKDTLDISYNKPLKDEELNVLREKYKINLPFSVSNELYEEVNHQLDKRLNKILNKWNELKQDCLNDLKLKEVIEFLETKNIKINFNVDNIKINDNYEEELINGNAKIFNILASKSPFVLSLSNDNFYYTKCNISKSDLMNKYNPTGRNISFGIRSHAMGGIANGLATLGFKVFISCPLRTSELLKPYIKMAAFNNFPVNYIFTNDTFTNPDLETGFSVVDEINSLRLIPNLINFRPSDINEIIGIYHILSNYKKTSTITIGSDKSKKIIGTNPKYVVAGAYRVRREKGEANAILIASGNEVSKALKIADELFPYGIDLRVISMPSKELFELQNDRYRFSLIPDYLKTFVLEYSESSLWNKYATNNDYILGINKFGMNGSREELLKYYNLDIDSIKTKILEIMKNN